MPQPTLALVAALLLSALLPSGGAAVAAPEPVLPSSTQSTIEWVPGQVVGARSRSGVELRTGGAGADAVELVGETPDRDLWTIEVLTEVSPVTGVRIEFLSDGRFPASGPGLAGNGNLVLSEVTVGERSPRGSRVEGLPLRYCSATFSQVGYPITDAMDGDPRSGWAVSPRTGQDHAAIFELAQGVQHRGGTVLVLELAFEYGQRHLPGRVRVSTTSSPDPARSVRTSQVDMAMQLEIDRAVTRGVDFLLSRQELDGSWLTTHGGYPTGGTALAVFALAKAGLKPEHPAMRRGLAFLRAHPPVKTYSAGCHLLALSSLGRPEHREWIEELTELVLSWKQPHGWAYPEGEVDISCTQYAALGLRAAAQYGVEIEREVWEELCEMALHYQEEPARLPGEPAGFAYKPGGVITGSRTTAGLTLLAVAEEFLKHEGGLDRPWRESKERGLAWIGRNFTASTNPQPDGGGRHWIYYYLYGVERVGSMLQTATLGGADWYVEGARFLLAEQGGKGQWMQDEEISDTSFALLFLTRGSGPTTGGASVSRRTFHAPAPAGGLELRAAGDTPLNLWVAGHHSSLDQHSWPATDQKEAGLRLAHVSYVGSRAPILPDARGESTTWLLRDREPPAGWEQPGFQDSSWSSGPGGFGLIGTPGPAVRTEWDTPELFLRRSFELDPEDWVEPTLTVNFSNLSPTNLGGHSGPLLCLFDDDPRFLGALDRGRGQASEELADVWSGRRAVRVTPDLRENPQVPGWAFKIAKRPREGEFRYLHFAWKKLDEGGIMLQLAREGQWKKRYHAGENSVGWESESVDRRAPRRWEVVTRDLYEDFGGEALLTGIALTPMSGGPALFDGIYLGQSKSDFRAIDPMAGRTIEASATQGPVHWTVWLNGEEVASGHGTTEGYEAVADLSGRLLLGDNLLAARVRRMDSGGQAFDLGLDARRVLGRTEVDPDQPWLGQRFPMRATFDRPGDQRIEARAVLVRPDGRPLEVASAPLEVPVTGALDPLLLRYAGDRARNLLMDDSVRIEVSSEREGFGKARLSDGLVSGGWLCDENDPEPRLRLELDRGVRARRVLLTPTRWAEPARPFRVRVAVNGRAEVIEIDPDPLRKTELELGRSLRVNDLEVVVLERRDARPGRASVGFAEIELQED